MSSIYRPYLSEKAKVFADEVFFMISNMEYQSAQNDIPLFLKNLRDSLSEEPSLYMMVIEELESLYSRTLLQMCDQHEVSSSDLLELEIS